MMLKKKNSYGFNGFFVPSIPRAPRSARGRVLRKRKFDESQVCAIELLASLAGKLLQEGEGSSASSNASEASEPAFTVGVIEQEQDENRTPKSESLDQGSCEESIFNPDCASQDGDKKCHPKDFSIAESDSNLEQSSLVIKRSASDNAPSDLKSGIHESTLPHENFLCKVSRDCPDSGESGNEFSIQGKAGQFDDKVSNGYNSFIPKDPADLCLKLCALNNSNTDVESLKYREHVTMSSVSRFRNNVKVGNRDYDDDENFSRLYNSYAKKIKPFRPSTRIGGRRVRKLLSSKYWNGASMLKDRKLSTIEGGMKSLYCKRKISCSRERYQYKRRKLFNRSFVVASDEGFSSRSVYKSPENRMSVGKCSSASTFHGEKGVLSSVIGNKSASHSINSHVKFSIKSFRIPEILIEVPETATVGSLKRAVVETMTAVLGARICIGVHLHGKKVRDDSRTLLQTGITSKENLDTLGFALEPNPIQAPTPMCTENPPNPLICDSSQLVPRSPATATVLDSVASESPPDPPLLTNSASNIESNHESVLSHTDVVTDTTSDKNLFDSKALVTVPSVNAEPLAAVPANLKPKRLEFVQRRTRRPFSVSEVEALVRAVEELGTGRWRDVKLRSFENADHRTYVDLKDKWKTLVHTAKIAPQQRRGEPVPQELLDRVLAADAFWSQRQVKQHSKNQAAIGKITDSNYADINGVEDMLTIM